MAQFYAEIQGNRGEATRMGSKASGIHTHIRGWNVGVRVQGHHTVAGEDEFTVYATTGSNGGGSSKLIATINRGSNGEPRVTVHEGV